MMLPSVEAMIDTGTMSVRTVQPRAADETTSTPRTRDSRRRLQQIAAATCTASTGSARVDPCSAAGTGLTASSTEPQWLTDVRRQLPLTDRLIYLQTGGHGPALDSVLKATAEAAEDDAHVGMPVTTDVRPEFFKAAGLGSGMSGSAAAQTRQALGELLGCSPDAVAVLSSTSIALYTVIMASQWEEGDELIISNLEHVCIASVAQGLEARHGVKVTAVAADEGDECFLAALAATLSSRTRLVVLSHVASPTGHVLPVAVSNRPLVRSLYPQTVARFPLPTDARASVGCYVQDAVETVQKHISEASPQSEGQLTPRVVIDGAQAIGQIQVDVTAIGCDYYIGSGHKWLCGKILIHCTVHLCRMEICWADVLFAHQQVCAGRSVRHRLPVRFTRRNGRVLAISKKPSCSLARP